MKAQAMNEDESDTELKTYPNSSLITQDSEERGFAPQKPGRDSVLIPAVLVMYVRDLPSVTARPYLEFVLNVAPTGALRTADHRIILRTEVGLPSALR